jgi:hypothetical protein
VPEQENGSLAFHWHAPLVQTLFEGQTFPQLPQFATLEVVLTQRPLQLVNPLGHAHWALLQTKFCAQICPQKPQCSGFD